MYGTSPSNLNLTFNDPALAASHTVNLQGLSALTTYYFKARSRDLAGNVTTSDVQTFTTLATPAILFVDDDFGESYDRFFRSALQANGYTFDHWDVAAAGGVTPSSAVMANYKLVVWNTGYAYSGTGAGLSSGEQSAISNYLNGGGRIFISGQDILFTGVTASFRQNYLKVASFTNDVRSSSYTASGVAGHPIGGGLNIPMAAPTDFPSIYADALTPTAGANGFLNHLVSGTSSPFSSVSFRGSLNAGGFGMVFMTTPFEAISTTATSPNNQVSFLKRVVDYLRPEVLVSAPSPSSTTTEAGGVSNFTVVLNSAPSANVVVPVSSSNPAEGVVNLSSLTFTPANWSTPQTVTVTGVDDSLDDNDQAYVIQLGAVTSADLAFNGFNPPDLNLVNLDNEFFPGIAVTAPTVTNEGNSGLIAVNFTVALSAAAPQAVSVDYSTTSNGYANSATPGRDYTSVSGRLDFAPGETSKTVSVNVRGDRLVELDEWFGLQLSNAQQGYLVDDLADVKISDEDTWAHPKEIDFGTELSPIKGTAAGVGDLPYDPVKGIGWYSGLANLQIVDRGLGTPGLRDIALTSNSGLALNVPNGNYLVIVTFGDALQAHDQMRLTLEGLAKPLVNTAANQFLTRAYATAVTDGQLNLVFSDHGGIDPNAAIAGIAFQRR